VGLERPASGEIWIDGTNIVKLGDRSLDRVRRKFAVVFQKYALLDSRSVFDNVAFPLHEETELSNAEITKRVHRALGELEVDDAALKLPGELSGGTSPCPVVFKLSAACFCVASRCRTAGRPPQDAS
jgi:phospholipid/cholesterol/gamma-HCH transport system ATP-binding protein